jgi:hypothetical protein
MNYLILSYKNVDGMVENKSKNHTQTKMNFPSE